MGNVTSTLTMKLIDGVTMPAKKVEALLEGVESAAKRLQRQQGRGLERRSRVGASAWAETLF